MAALTTTADEILDRDQLTLSLISDLRTETDPRVVESLLDQVVRLNLPLARSIAGSYARRGIDSDDLLQVASLALLKAIYGFDLERGPSFAAYAVPTIRGEVRRHFRDHGSLVRPPRELQELRLAIAVARNDITQRKGREATVTDLCEALGQTEAQVRRAEIAAANHRAQSLDAPTPGGGTFGDRLADPDDNLSRLEWRVTLQDAVQDLDARSQAILRMRFVEDLTQTQIAEQIGVSQMQVSRLLTRIIGQLRERIAVPA